MRSLQLATTLTLLALAYVALASHGDGCDSHDESTDDDDAVADTATPDDHDHDSDSLGTAITITDASPDDVEGGIHLHLSKAEPNPPKVGDNIITVSLMQNDHSTLVDGARLTVKAIMPAHNHGTPKPITVTDVGTGKYEIAIMYHMPGNWQVTIEAEASNLTASLVARIEVE